MNTGNIVNLIWFIICSINLMIAVSVLIVAIAYRRRCFTFPCIFTLNTIFAFLIFSIVGIIKNVYVYLWDQQTDPVTDVFCSIRGYVYHSSIAAIHHSLVLQAIGRYAQVRQFNWFRSRKTKCSIILLQWILDFTFDLPPLITGNMVKLNSDNICFISMYRFDLVSYMACFSFLLSNVSLGILYRALVKYVNDRSTLIENQQARRIQKNVTIVRRVVFLNLQLAVFGIPVLIFTIANAIRTSLLPNKFLRILMIILNMPITPTIVLLCRFTPELVRSLLEIMKKMPFISRIAGLNRVHMNNTVETMTNQAVIQKF